jgi:hypothetical protein
MNSINTVETSGRGLYFQAARKANLVTLIISLVPFVEIISLVFPLWTDLVQRRLLGYFRALLAETHKVPPCMARYSEIVPQEVSYVADKY